MNSRYEQVEFTNMCMIYDDNGNILVQDRVKKDWSGIAFPGGHIEPRESFSQSVIREVFEETGLTIKNPKICGIKHFYCDDGSHYVVTCYKTNKFSGTIKSSPEGKIFWMKLEDFFKSNLAYGMENMIKLFIDEDICELYLKNIDGNWVDELI